MPVVKVSVSVREDLWQQLQVELDGSPGSVSAVVNDALERYLRRQAGIRAADEVLAELGPPTEEELVELDERYRAAGMYEFMRKPPLT